MYLSAETITKSAWLCVAAIGVCLSMAPPQPVPPDDLRKKYEDPGTVSDNESRSANYLTVTHSPTSPPFDYKTAGVAFGTFYFPYIYLAVVVFITTLDTLHALDLFPHIMPVDHTMAAKTFNGQLLVGLTITTSSSALRFAAFQTLGRFFTYQLSILPKHELVTHGLYSYARHPSYTALVLGYAGTFLRVTAPGSVLYDYLGVDAMRKLTIVLALAIGCVVYAFIRRAEIEDRVLQKEFGEEWDEWARVVRYKFVPGIL